MVTTIEGIRALITRSDSASHSSSGPISEKSDTKRMPASRALHTKQSIDWRKSRRKCGDVVYYNVNCHVNLTNICSSRCKFCAFGRDAEDAGAYAMTKAQAIAVVRDAMRDPDLAGLHC